LEQRQIVYIAAEVRTGKTLMALHAAAIYRAKSVLFLTKKKAISSIFDDYSNFGYSEHFAITIINDESLHLVTGEYDLVIHDEHHRFGAFPKPNKGAKTFRERFAHLPMIFLSGTPTPESFSQIYHQLWVSNRSPFLHKNFYIWAKSFVNVYQVDFGFGKVNQYEKCDYDKIKPFIDPLMIKFTQKEAGFVSEVTENVMEVSMTGDTYAMTTKLRKDLVIEMEQEVILADTAVKLMGKLHQMYSGTIKFESGNAATLDLSKAEFIKSQFAPYKIAIFYKFKQELLLLRSVFGDSLTDDLDEFNSTDKNIALQIQSGREGISLAAAKYLIYYNLDFSATSYWQSRDRMTTMHRPLNDVYYIFSLGGIEKMIYREVTRNKDYTLKHFIKYNNNMANFILNQLFIVKKYMNLNVIK